MGAVQQRALPGEYVVGSEDAIIEAVEREPWNPPRDIARELGVFLPACHSPQTIVFSTYSVLKTSCPGSDYSIPSVV